MTRLLSTLVFLCAFPLISMAQEPMYIPMRISSHLEVIKKRALELKDHLDLVKEGG